jgi:hypothetical protein
MLNKVVLKAPCKHAVSGKVHVITASKDGTTVHSNEDKTPFMVHRALESWKRSGWGSLEAYLRDMAQAGWAVLEAV